MYLDTSDYARLYRSDADSETIKVREFLIKHVDAGLIRVPVSYLTLFELLQDYETQYLEDRRSRARLLSRLSQCFGFPFLSDLIEGITDVSLGGWFPRDINQNFTFGNIREQFRQGILEEKTLTREQRRKLNNRNFLAEFLRSNPTLMKFSQDSLNGFPLPKSFVDGQYFRRYFAGEISEKRANQELRKCLSDPIHFFELWFQYYNRPNPLNDMLEKPIKTIRASIDQLQELLKVADASHKRFLEQKAKLKREHQKLSKMIRVHDLKAKLPNLDIPKLSDVRTILKKLEFSALQKFPEHFRSHSKEYFLAFARGRKFKDSDIADLIHSFYLPHCDLWRGDKTFSNLLIKSKVRHHERIVSSLGKLPERIEGILKSR